MNRIQNQIRIRRKRARIETRMDKCCKFLHVSTLKELGGLDWEDSTFYIQLEECLQLRRLFFDPNREQEKKFLMKCIQQANTLKSLTMTPLF